MVSWLARTIRELLLKLAKGLQRAIEVIHQQEQWPQKKAFPRSVMYGPLPHFLVTKCSLVPPDSFPDLSRLFRQLMHSVLVLVDRPGRGTARELARVNDRDIIVIDGPDGKRVYGVPWARLPLRESQLRPLRLPPNRHPLHQPLQR